jgi:hypothetical protein
MKKSAKVDKFVRLILEFSSEKDPQKRHQQLYRIKNEAYHFGYMVLDQVKRRDTGVSIHYQNKLVEILERWFENTGPIAFSLSADVFAVGSNKAGSVMITHIHGGENYEDLSKMLVMLFAHYGYKGIDRCSICNGFYLYRRERDLNLCSGKCKAKFYREKKKEGGKK